MPRALDQSYLFIFARSGSINVFGVARRAGIICPVLNGQKGH